MEQKTSLVELKVDEKGVGTAVLATLNVPDRDSDVVLPGAFGRQQGIPVLASHEWTEPPLGKSEIYETDTEVRADFKLNMALSRARSWYEAARFDLQNPPARMNYSWGFTIPEGGSSVGEFQGKRVRFLRRVVAHEISFVLLGSSVGTRTLALKQDVASATAAAVAEYERLRTKMAIEEYERIRKRAQGQHAYKYVKLWASDQPYRTARSVAKCAARELGIRCPAISIFAPSEIKDADFTHDEKIAGFAHTGGWEIGIRADIMGEREIAFLAAHETRHLAGGTEAEADAFAEEFTAKVFGPASPRSKSGGSVSFDPVEVAQALRARGMSAKEIRKAF